MSSGVQRRFSERQEVRGLGEGVTETGSPDSLEGRKDMRKKGRRLSTERKLNRRRARDSREQQVTVNGWLRGRDMGGLGQGRLGHHGGLTRPESRR